MGELAARHSDIVIVTTEDPYDDNPSAIIDEMLAGAKSVQAELSSLVVKKIIDRRAAIRQALVCAKPHDLVLITGKGTEQKMIIGGRYISWDDRQVVREELNFLREKFQFQNPNIK
jgi:UDP-N-acetylmuramyl tripeptide synthase